MEMLEGNVLLPDSADQCTILHFDDKLPIAGVLIDTTVVFQGMGWKRVFYLQSQQAFLLFFCHYFHFMIVLDAFINPGLLLDTQQAIKDLKSDGIMDQVLICIGEHRGANPIVRHEHEPGAEPIDVSTVPQNAVILVSEAEPAQTIAE